MPLPDVVEVTLVAAVDEFEVVLLVGLVLTLLLPVEEVAVELLLPLLLPLVEVV